MLQDLIPAALFLLKARNIGAKIRRFIHMKSISSNAIIFIVTYESGSRKGAAEMFQVGDQIIYGLHGICRIIGTEFQTVNRKNVEYIVLEPVQQPGSRYYVPKGNQAALNKLKPILTLLQLEQLLVSDEAKADCWIADENLRKQRYREIIGSGNRAALISMVRTLHSHKQAQLTAGRKFHLSDENFLRDAEKLLNEEFSLVLNIPACCVADYIIKNIK